jgi:hypothetical protein
LEKVQREKQNMRVQFAREIEAAQAQLGEREIELGHQHFEALEQLEEESKRGMGTADRKAGREGRGIRKGREGGG